MADGITYIIDAAAVQQALDSVAGAIAHPKGLMDALGGHFVFSAQRNIETETAPDGTKWPPLSPRTANKRIGRKGRRGYAHMLRVTARLYQSLSYEATDTSVEWGSNVKYARIHQLGGTIDMPAREGHVTLKSIRRKGGGVRSRFARRGAKGATERAINIRGHQIHIPARPYLGISAADEAAIPAIAAEYLRSEVAR